jgi:hypothetical protein
MAICSRAKRAAERKSTQPEADRSPSANSATVVMVVVMAAVMTMMLCIGGARQTERRPGDEHQSQSQPAPPAFGEIYHIEPPLFSAAPLYGTDVGLIPS